MLWPTKSSEEIYNVASNHSGYYWVKNSNGSIIKIFCEMTKSCGNKTGLTRVASINSNSRLAYCTGDIDYNNIDGCYQRSPFPDAQQ